MRFIYKQNRGGSVGTGVKFLSDELAFFAMVSTVQLQPLRRVFLAGKLLTQLTEEWK